MSQKKTKKPRQAPAYSADTLALRLMAGLALVALGGLIFLAAVIRMNGEIFEGLRRLCYGFTGGVTFLLPVLPVWGGVLVILSTQRRVHAKPFVFASLAFLGISAFVMLISRYGSSLLMERIGELNRTTLPYTDDWTQSVSRAFSLCGEKKAGGGALGEALAWPLFMPLGSFLSGVIFFVLTLFCLLMIFGLTPRVLIDWIKGEGLQLSKERTADRRAQSDRNIAWQQEQARQQAILQQQAYMRQQYEAQQRQQAEAQRLQQEAGQFGQQENQQNQSGIWPGQTYNTEQRQAFMPPSDWSPDRNAPAHPKRPKSGSRETEAVGGYADASQPADPRDFQNQPNGVQDFQNLVNTEMAGKSRLKSRLFNRSQPETDPARPETKSRIFDRTQSDPAPAQGSRVSRRSRRETEPWPVQPGETVPADETGTPNAEPNPFRRPDQSSQSFTNPLPVTRTERPRETRTPEHGKFRRASGAAERVVPEMTDWPPRAAQNPEPSAPVQEPAQAPEQPSFARPANMAESAQMSDQLPFARPADMPEPSESPEQLHFAPSNDIPDSPEAPEQPSFAPIFENPEPVRRENRRPVEKPAIAVPKVQQEIKKDAWNPDLKLPPSTDPANIGAEDEIYTPVPYHIPLITNLKLPARNTENTDAEDAFRSQRLEETLASFKVQAHVVNVTHGPAISRFELELAPGTKVNKINELVNDIAYGMEATSVRIEAPIPGKSLVGVEVPNRKVATVTLREVLESDRMQNAKSILTVALGKDIAGVPIVCDLAKMPHMLIAGATGSGKSVCINAIINSLLYRAGPDEVRLILVDPKVVELQCYNGIPHLLIPVVNDPHKASAALAWAVAEMMDRYDKFARAKVRALDAYNASLGPHEKPMPRIVIIIDELADLMMVCKKDVEEYICRLTQLARAAGIHLIVATQRPSVDVITGLIKANIPSRIAFKTASYVDSRTILDRNGSEQLLGWGDMLYLPTGSFAPTRVQGCFLSDDEVNAIVADVRKNNPSSYDPNVLEQLEQITHEKETPAAPDIISGTPSESGDADRDLFDQAVEMALQDGQISTSTLQRRLKIGYSRAGRLTDELEERGIVAQKDGSKPRKCLITREDWENLKQSTDAEA